MSCPSPYTNCADPASHPEMCISGSQKSYSDRHPANKKCCPPNHSCGPAYDSPCEDLQTREVTPARYISAEEVFAGCHEPAWLTPQAVGGIVAVGVLVFVALCFAALWCVRRSLYRPVARKGSGSRRKRGGSGSHARVGSERGSAVERSQGGAILEMGAPGSRGGITVTREVKVEGEGGVEV